MIWFVLNLFICAFAAKPTYSYWHVYVGADGLSRQTRCQFEKFELKGVTKGVAPQWLNQLSDQVAKFTITTQPAGWVGDWHENPGPQWIIPLEGRWFVETSDGKRVEMGPGEVSLGEDQMSKIDAHGHRGHLSGTLGDTPATLMIVSLKTSPKSNQPCHQR